MQERLGTTGMTSQKAGTRERRAGCCHHPPVTVAAGETAVVGGGGRQRYQHPWQTGLGWNPAGFCVVRASVPPEAQDSHLLPSSKPWKAAQLHAEVAQS